MGLKIKAERLFTPLREFHDVCVDIENGRIVSIGKSKTFVTRRFPILTAAFIDSHTHGALGIDIMSATVEDLLKLSEFYVGHGISCFFPTTVSDSFENLSKVAETVKQAMKSDLLKAKIGGLYIEGPYLSPNKSGAHKKELLKKPDLQELSWFLSEHGDVTKIFAIAPELERADKAIHLLRKFGIVVTIAHTNATYEETLRAIEAGANRATHVFNAMREFNHREPGVIGAVLTKKDIYCEVICDLIHLHPASIEIVFKSKGPFRTILVSDSISATGLQDGVYELGQMEVEVKQGIAKIRGQNVLAGSTLTIDRAVKNLVFNLDIPLRSAFIMASYTPAKASGIEPNLLAEGRTANIVALDDELNPLALYVEGRLVYEA